MRMQMIDWNWDARALLRRRWTPGGVMLAAVLGVIALALAVTLLMVALAGAVLLGGAYLGYRLLRVVLAPQIGGDRAARSPRLSSRDARGLIEMARTTDPIDRYLLAVQEFDRLSAAVLALDPAELGRARVRRRAAALAEQAENLHDAVAEIERQVASDPTAAGALACVWELSVATADLASYCLELRQSRRTPALKEIRTFIARRTLLLGRRDGLVERLSAAELRRPAGSLSVTGRFS